DRDPTKRALIGQHLQHILDGLGVAEPDVPLDPVHVIGVAIDLLPPLEPRVVEVLPHHLLVAAADLLRLEPPPPLGVGQGEHGGEGGDGAASDDGDGGAVDVGGQGRNGGRRGGESEGPGGGGELGNGGGRESRVWSGVEADGGGERGGERH
ncbi:hypothetical protein TorRG33x02_066680, partial [Trema orientale]